MPRYDYWKLKILSDKTRPLRIEGSILANNLEEAARKVRDRTGKHTVLITRGIRGFQEPRHLAPGSQVRKPR